MNDSRHETIDKNMMGPINNEVAFALCTQHPWVQITAPACQPTLPSKSTAALLRVRVECAISLIEVDRTHLALATLQKRILYFDVGDKWASKNRLTFKAEQNLVCPRIQTRPARREC